MNRAVLIGGSLAVVASFPGAAAAQAKPVDQQIMEAVNPLAEGDRDGATVMGYREGETLEVIRQGTNHFVCLADPPGDEQFQVSCYHRDLEPFMARGRELRLAGKGMAEVRQMRASEIEAGTLKIPYGASMYSLFGSVNPETGRPDSVSMLQVIYLPYASPESTGLSSQRRGNAPFLMDPGQHRAHLMIPAGTRKFP
jgi:hypothetical protein